MLGTAIAIGRPGFRIPVLLLIALMALSISCARRFPATEVTPIKVDNPAELQRYLLSHKPDVAQFRMRGPFAVIERRDLEIPLVSGPTVEADLYLCAAARKAPLVIVLHGYNNSKEDHAFQAMHLASWGMHGLAIDLPKQGPWIANGRTLAKLVDAIHRTPQLIDDRIDANKIILVGHSFGATAVATALGQGAPALRRRASRSRRDRPGIAAVAAADHRSRDGDRCGRGHLAHPQPRAILPLHSGRGRRDLDTGHGPRRCAVSERAHAPRIRGKPDDTEDAQIAFVSALTSSAFGLAATGGIDYGWNSFENAFKNGMFFNARRK